MQQSQAKGRRASGATNTPDSRPLQIGAQTLLSADAGGGARPWPRLRGELVRPTKHRRRSARKAGRTRRLLGLGEQ